MNVKNFVVVYIAIIKAGQDVKIALGWFVVVCSFDLCKEKLMERTFWRAECTK